MISDIDSNWILIWASDIFVLWACPLYRILKGTQEITTKSIIICYSNVLILVVSDRSCTLSISKCQYWTSLGMGKAIDCIRSHLRPIFWSSYYCPKIVNLSLNLSQASLNLVWLLGKNESEFNLILCILSLISIFGGISGLPLWSEFRLLAKKWSEKSLIFV